MLKFRDISIRTKLTLIMALTAAIALLLVTSALMVYEFQSTRRTVAQELSSLADVVGGNSAAALAFDDAKAASEILGALGARPGIVAAYLYDTRGGVFASYLADVGAVWLERSPQPEDAYRRRGPGRRTGPATTQPGRLAVEPLRTDRDDDLVDR